MKKYRYQPILIVFIVIGLIASLIIGVERHRIEENSKTVELAIDYEGLLELAEREGLPPSEVLAKAREAGISSLAVYETTFKKLNKNGKAMALAGAEILAGYHAGTLSAPVWRQLVESGEIVGTEIYIVGHDKAVFAELKEDLLLRFGEERVKPLMVGGEEVLAVKDNYEAFLKRHLGMPTDEMRAVNAAGFQVIARPTNYTLCTPAKVEAVFRRLDGIDISAIVFSGSEVLGATKALDTTVKEMRAMDVNMGAIEGVTQLKFYPQEGLEAVAHGIGYDKVARLYSIPKDEQPKLKIDAAVDRWITTDEERNIRINLMRIYEDPAPNISLMETNMMYISKVRDKLVEHGFTVGKAGTFEAYYPSVLLRALVILGVVAGGMLYLSLIIPWLNNRPRFLVIAFGIIGILSIIPLLMGAGSKLRLIASLASANIFPALAIIAQLDLIRNRKFKPNVTTTGVIIFGFGALIVTSALAFIGAAYLSGSLTDVEYLLEFQIFRGIKLTFVLPIILVAIAFLQRFDVFDGRFEHSTSLVNQLKEILDMPVKIKTLIGAFLVLAAAVIFIARSGHTMGMPVMGLELKFRAFLEQLLYARPRTKEMLIGHPAFMLAALAVFRRWPTMVLFALVLVATIGQGSMVETFAHMRSPIYMSLVRGIGGVVLGGLIGTLAILAVAAWQRILDKVAK